MTKEVIPLLLAAIVLLLACAVSGVYAANNSSQFVASPMRAAQSGVLLDPMIVPKYINHLTGPPPVYVSTVGNEYRVVVTAFDQQMLPPSLPKTHVWGYGGLAKDAVTGAPLGFVRSAPGPTFEATRGTPITVTWTNGINAPYMFAVDPSLHWANPNNMPMPREPVTAPPFPPGYYAAQSPVPIVTHLHGGEDQSTSDGHPDAWWTYNGKHGPTYTTSTATDPNSAVFHYPNAQPPTTLWYHDHALGLTRLNVLSGLAGFYLLRDPADSIAPLLPSGKYEMPLVIQDRSFYADGSLSFPSNGQNPTIHPYWREEFFGNTIIVNAKAWPNMNVDRGLYRFRLLDGSNARYYTLSFSNGMPFTMIGSDGGYLKALVTLTNLTIAPGERADVLVDFTNVTPGTKIILRNTANAPFPDGDPPTSVRRGRSCSSL
jgi:spore coat protein A